MLARLVGLSREDLSPVLRLAAVHAVLGGAVAAGDACVQAVFMARAGAESLPVVLIARALGLPLLSVAYTRFASRRSPRAVLGVLGVGAAVSSVVAWALMRTGAPGAIAAYALHEIASGLLTVHWGVYLLASLAGDAALRGVGLVYAGARLGAAIAGAGVVAVTAAWGAESAMVLAAAAFAVLALLHRVGGAGASPRPRLGPEGSMRSRWAAARSPLLAAIIASTVIMVGVRFLLRYQQQEMLDAMDEDALGTLLGTYVIIANVATALLAVIVMGRLLPFLRVPGANLLYTLVVLGAQLGLALAPGVPSALLARFADGELKHTLKTPVSSLFYEAFPDERRSAARAIVLGLASPAAQAVGAIFLAVLVAGADLATAAVVGLALCAAFTLATLAQNRRFGDSLRRQDQRGERD